MCARRPGWAPRSRRCRPETRIRWGAARAAPVLRIRLSGNELLALGALAVACIVAAGILMRSWWRRRRLQPLVAAIVVLVVGAGAIGLVLLGVPYRLPVGAAFIAALLAVMISSRSERRAP